jgi:hypothetical protein
MIPLIAAQAPAVFWICGGGLLLTAADIIMIYYLEQGRSGYVFAAAFLVYMLGMLCLCFSYFGEDIAMASIAIVLVNVITLAIVNAFFFGHVLTSLSYFAMALGAIAFVILEFFA